MGILKTAGKAAFFLGAGGTGAAVAFFILKNRGGLPSPIKGIADKVSTFLGDTGIVEKKKQSRQSALLRAFKNFGPRRRRNLTKAAQERRKKEELVDDLSGVGKFFLNKFGMKLR